MRRKYTLNEDAFRHRTPEMAYWLGFILGDGCVVARRDGVPRYLVVGLAGADSPHLDALAKFLSYSGPVWSRMVWTPGGQRVPRATLCVGSRPLSESLRDLGVEPRKSTREKVPPGFERDVDFWRGLIDADGCLSWMRPRQAVVSFVGSGSVCGAFSEFVVARFRGHRPTVRPAGRVCTVHLAGQRAADLAGDLYANGPHLARKKTIADAFVARYAFRPASPRFEWRAIGRDGLLSLFQRLGSWAAVARELGQSHANTQAAASRLGASRGRAVRRRVTR